MKKVLKAVGITSAVMIILMGIAAFVFFKNYRNEQKEDEKRLREELDMQIYGFEKEKVEDDEKLPLLLKGDGKNVVTYPVKSLKDIYDVDNSKEIMEKLNDLKKRNKYTLENPLWAYNPFGTHELSLYLYFEAKQDVSLRYTIHIENEDIPDFTRTARVQENAANRAMECVIAGLVPQMENYIILKLYDNKGKEVKRMVYTITPPSVGDAVQKQLTLKDGNSLTEISNGLYFFLGHDSDNKSMPKKIYLYDNSGVLRGAIPLINGRAVRVMFLNDRMLYNCGNSRFAEVSWQGQVMKTYDLSGYTLENDFTYDGFGNLIAIATKKKAKTTKDQVVALNLQSGKTKRLLSMDALLKKVKAKAKNKKDWIGLNSVIWAGGDSIILSAGELSGILKIGGVSSIKPRIRYIIGDEELWKEQGRTKGLLAKYEEDEGETEGLYVKPEPFESQFAQSSVALSESRENGASQYYLTMFNNNYNKKKAKESYFYEYFIDEEAGTYDLVKSFKVPYSTYESSVTENQGNIIVNSGTDCSVSEYDKDGGLISQLKYNVETYTYRIFKNNLKNFWFS